MYITSGNTQFHIPTFTSWSKEDFFKTFKGKCENLEIVWEQIVKYGNLIEVKEPLEIKDVSETKRQNRSRKKFK